ncbi:hypothetical protein EJ05DRAFT_204818 [Pseudovirgaria hyperparasitica]|uniref:Uncharacterized protein n=1 Tax=Pseudovirgaria hyperparasitica TaxID=470096 RepID=A0A6A6WJE2_9PEZI|nr:uncharacterized protein EJ05DRAFT_204818 [Pseudovirgaria hyperparasitica]KAF2762306.1 hypothetical protein EJ05DRAFT_204818 [Pseudovirgaria hyperparasitica]
MDHEVSCARMLLACIYLMLLPTVLTNNHFHTHVSPSAPPVPRRLIVRQRCHGPEAAMTS